MKGISLRRACILAATIFTITQTFAQSGYTVTERGPDWKVMQKTEVVNGTNRIHKYTELATGLHYTNAAGQLVESREQITILPQGGASATQGRHKVYFPGNIYNGVLEVVTPDGRHVKSRPLGVSYDDGSNTVFIATLKSAIGYLTSSNTITYRDAFDGIKADLVCTYRRGGFECDLVFRQQPPTPGDYGLDESFSTLQMVTEFFNTQDPEQIPAGYDEWFGLQDVTLKFGKLTMTHGKAFAFKGTNSISPRPLGGEGQGEGAKPVYKSWVKAEGRTFLIEQVPVVDVAEDLNALPLTASIEKPASSIKYLASSRKFPASHALIACTNQILLAAADFTKEPGVVLDYTTIDSDQTDFTFASGETYYLCGFVQFSGATTINAGAVLKFLDDGTVGGSANLTCNGSISWNTTADRPAVFTSEHDDSVGEILPTSNGQPSQSVETTYLTVTSATNVFQHCRFKYAWVGVSGGSEFDDCHFIQCGWGIMPAVDSPVVKNSLVVGCGGLTDCSAACYHVTFDTCDCAVLEYGWFMNCILSRLNQISYGEGSRGSHSGYYDSGSYCDDVWPVTILTNPFRSAGIYYLTTNSPCRNTGTTAIDSGLLAELQTLTTYAPQDGGYPDTNAPDLGYHYPVNEDSDYDGLPDWWEWKYFGDLNQVLTNLDCANGQTLGYDYSNNITPTVFKYTGLEVSNNYVSSSQPAVQLNVVGTPYYIATLIDDDELSNAVWNAYSGSSVTVNLGSSQGWHEVWIGLRAHADDPIFAVWQRKRLKLDWTPPTLFVTNPTNTVVDIPMIQLKGFSPEALSRISYDLTNAVGLLTNQQILVLNQYYDTTTWEFTTNTWQAFDVMLTNGMNAFIFHATDLAGNTATASYNLTADYSAKTNPPGVQVSWPQNGTQVSGNSFTLNGQVADSTVTVTATTTSSNGLPSTVNGLVERTGKFWLENLPLNSGTNAVTLTATDVAGNVTTTNLIVIQSAVTLTINPFGNPTSGNPQQLWQPTVNLSGSISDATYAVWVNGVKGHNYGNGWWSASNVPVDSGGTATFTATAYAPNEQQPDGGYGNP